jgi:hypothetical protein
MQKQSFPDLCLTTDRLFHGDEDIINANRWLNNKL